MSAENSAQLRELHDSSQSASWNPAFRPEDASGLNTEGGTIQFDRQTTEHDEGSPVNDLSAANNENEDVHEQSGEPAHELGAGYGYDTVPESYPPATQNKAGEEDRFFDHLSDPNAQPETFNEGSQTREIFDVDTAGPADVSQHATTAHEDQEEDAGAHVISRPDADSLHGHGQDGRVPPLGLRRTESDAFNILKRIDRSSTFPSFMPQEPQRLPSGQAETIVENNDMDRPLLNGHVPEIERDTEGLQKPSHDSTWFDEQEQINPDIEETSFFDKIDQEEEATQEPTDAEARFEEGLPLVNDPVQDEHERAPDAARRDADDFFSSGAQTDEGSFFDQPISQAAPQEEEQRYLERKNTTQVFSSMHLESHGSRVDRELLPPTETAPELAEARNSAKEVQGAKQEDLDAMWKAALADDEFLVEDDDDELLSDSSNDSRSSFLNELKSGAEVPAPVTTSDIQDRPPTQRSTGSYTPHQSSTAEMFSTGPWGGGLGLSQSGMPPANVKSAFPQQVQQRPAANKAESFVDQSKGGYKSPYDLPEDLSARPRKRVQMQPSTPSMRTSVPPPPPRSSSMASDKAFSPVLPQAPQPPPMGGWSRPGTASSTDAPQGQSPPSTGQAVLKPAASKSSFFEELPVTSKPRPPTGQGRYTPMQPPAQLNTPPIGGPHGYPSHFDPKQHRPAATAQMTPPAPSTQPPAPVTNQYAHLGLQKPERLDPYAHVPQQAAAPSIPMATRYSPVPPSSQPGPRISPSPRYSPAPPPQAKPQANQYASQPPRTAPPAASGIPFQPRASSPLAHHQRSAVPQPSIAPPSGTVLSPPTSPPSKRESAMSYSQHVEVQRKITPLSTEAVRNSSFAPPRRSQTQSPGKYEPLFTSSGPQQPPIPRPASVQGHPQPLASSLPYNTGTQQVPGRSRGPSQSANFISPNDGTQSDELQRWQGSPIFHFTAGGAVLSSFPKHVPRYTPGQTLPLIKPTPGPVLVRNAKDVLNVDHQAARFPGPLRTKSKKKELLAWLADRINLLEQVIVGQGFDSQLPNPKTCHDEKLLLWKILRVFVEYDGNLEGKPEAQKALTALLTPGAVDTETNGVHFNAASQDVGIYRPSGTQIQADAVDPSAIEGLRKNLVRGEREKAVWEAVDRKLWAHAMLIASTLDKAVWKQVVQEFVRREVKPVGENTEPLAALYQVFGGNLEDSIDELVPPSARAGLQMVSKITSSGPTKNALDGLNKWRETLSLVVNNRTLDDSTAISALGRLLMTYSRTEAAHICFILSKTPTPMLFGGVEDPHSSIVLLGANHKQGAIEIFHDEDAILLTEVYEYATSILATHASTSALMPHLQAYKLQRAVMLAENGHKNEALQYCEAIGGSLKSSTKLSPYYHPLFFAELDELSNRLKQAPLDSSSSSWKPSVEKMSGSLFSRFNSFVTGGEDSDAASTGSGKDANHEHGPFAKVVGTPTISREHSQVDLYSSYTGGGTQPLPIGGPSRYAPNSHYTPRSSSEFGRSPQTTMTQPQRSPSLEVNSNPYAPALSPYAPPQSSYEPKPATRSQAYEPMPSLTRSESPPAQAPQSYQPTPPPEQSAYSPQIPQEHGHTPAFGGYQPPPNISTFSPQQPSPPEDRANSAPPTETSSYNPYSGGYGGGGGYEPPSLSTGYVPYEPEPNEEGAPESTSQPKKKPSIMDLDDDEPTSSIAAASALPAKPLHKDLDRARRDAETDAAFRAAAEADAKRAEQQKTLKPKSSGWFGGLWGGAGSKSLDSKDGVQSNANEPKVIRAKLGEENSFYYDKELKKWVNKKDPGSATVGAKATPPPPRTGPPSRSASGMGVGPPLPSNLAATVPKPPSGLAQSTSMPSIPMATATGRSDSPAPTAAGRPPPPLMSSSSGGPPSIAASGRSTPAVTGAGSLDDLLGGPLVPRAGGTTRGLKKKRTGYVDIMAQGLPQPK